MKEAFPDLLGRLDRLTRDYAPQLEMPRDQLKEIVWPRELNADEMQLKWGTRIRFSETKRRQIMFEVHTILGLIWDDELDGLPIHLPPRIIITHLCNKTTNI